MEDISEHYSKEEGKSNHCEHCRVDFLVQRNSIRINNLLERPREVIRLYECGPCIYRLIKLIQQLYLRPIYILSLFDFMHLLIKDVLIFPGTPK